KQESHSFSCQSRATAHCSNLCPARLAGPTEERRDPVAVLQTKTPRLVKSYAMPVDAAVFSGVPGVTALAPLPSANVLLCAAMDRRVVCCDLKATPDGVKRIPGKHLAEWSHDNWVHALDVHQAGSRIATGGMDRRIKIWKWGEKKPLADFKAHDDW